MLLTTPRGFARHLKKVIVGIGVAIVSLIVMPLLASAKRKVASSIKSQAMHADSRQTDICAYLSAILVLGLGLNAHSRLVVG